MTLARALARAHETTRCNARLPLDGTGRVLRCDLPADHLPANDHIGSVRWTAKP
jgi:hypothetical protein